MYGSFYMPAWYPERQWNVLRCINVSEMPWHERTPMLCCLAVLSTLHIAIPVWAHLGCFRVSGSANRCFMTEMDVSWAVSYGNTCGVLVQNGVYTFLQQQTIQEHGRYRPHSTVLCAASEDGTPHTAARTAVQGVLLPQG